MKHKNTAYIDGAALVSNYRETKRLAGGAHVICAVKADAYGHGSELTARILGEAGCDFFAVSSEEEAVELRAIERENGRHPSILILGHIDPENVGEMIENDVICTVVSLENARLLSDEAMRLGGRLRIHIKLDTGMNRLGFPTADEMYLQTADEIEEISRDSSLGLCGIFTHFSSADDELMDGRILADYADCGGYTKMQLARYERLLEVLAERGVDVGLRHASNSAAILSLPEARFDAVRAGVMLYGMMPNGVCSESFKPVMTFVSSVSHIHKIKKGDRVSYGADFQAERDMTLATVTAGYADGFDRAYRGCHVAVGGQKLRQVGRICMDQFMIDVTDADVHVGDTVTLFGGDGGESANALARLSGTISYEVMCRVSKRVPRVLI